MFGRLRNLFGNSDRPDRTGPEAALDSRLRWTIRPSRWRRRTAELELLSELDDELRRRPRANVVLLTERRPSQLGRVLRNAFPGLTVHQVDRESESDDLHLALATWGRYDMIIDDSRRAGLRKRVFRTSWYHLGQGGVYVLWQQRTDPDSNRPHLDRRLVADWLTPDALGLVTSGTEHVIMENRIEAYAKMREWQMNEVIKNRRDGRAELIMQLPSKSFTSRAGVDPPELLGDDGRFKISINPPPMTVRCYRDAVVLPRQVALQGNLVLPESYRHSQRPKLSNRGMWDLSNYFATIDPIPSAYRLSGRYLHLDAEWRQHFGHLLTEQLSRLWAWPELKRQMPDLKAVLSLQRGHDRPEPWEQAIFAAAGVDPEDLIVINGPTQVDELVGATPMFSMPQYVDPRIVSLWDRVGDALVDTAARGDPGSGSSLPGGVRPGDPIFVSRPPGSKTRPCRNQADVEQYFSARGFRVVRPEFHPVPDQVRIFREASVIAGFGGSAMFNLIFRRDPVAVIVIRPASYTSTNEYLISAVRGNTVSMIDSVPDIDHPSGRWTWQAFYSGFTFDFDREGRRLQRVLDELAD